MIFELEFVRFWETSSTKILFWGQRYGQTHRGFCFEDRPTDRPSKRLREAPSRSLKMEDDIFRWKVNHNSNIKIITNPWIFFLCLFLHKLGSWITLKIKNSFLLKLLKSYSPYFLFLSPTPSSNFLPHPQFTHLLPSHWDT